jgi:hypothetical protein
MRRSTTVLGHHGSQAPGAPPRYLRSDSIRKMCLNEPKIGGLSTTPESGSMHSIDAQVSSLRRHDVAHLSPNEHFRDAVTRQASVLESQNQPAPRSGQRKSFWLVTIVESSRSVSPEPEPVFRIAHRSQSPGGPVPFQIPTLSEKRFVLPVASPLTSDIFGPARVQVRHGMSRTPGDRRR